MYFYCVQTTWKHTYPIHFTLIGINNFIINNIEIGEVINLQIYYIG